MTKLLTMKFLSITWPYSKKRIISDNSKVGVLSILKFSIVINLKTQREHIHLFDSSQELNPADSENMAVADFFNVEFEDNLTYESTNLKYRLSTPNTPQRLLSFNLGTKRVD